jgi:hypothetical protein
MKEALKQIGPIAEILDADSVCGKCASPNIYPSCRSVDKFDYYALTCSDCGAALSFGQRKDGGLWAKRKDENGNALDHRGWKLYLALASGDKPKATPAQRPASKAVPDSPELTGLLARIKNAPNDEEKEYILAEVFEAIDVAWGMSAANAAWDAALKKFGHPREKNSAEQVARHMFAVLHPGDK